MTFLAIVVGVVLGNFLWGFIKERRAYKYKWTCPDCTFTASANTQSIIDMVKEVHSHDKEN